MPTYWFCHACDHQIINPRILEDGLLCPDCGSDFLETVEAHDPDPPIDQEYEEYMHEEYDDDSLDIPGAFPSPTTSSFALPSPPSVPSRSASNTPSRPFSHTGPGPTSPSASFRFSSGSGGGMFTIGGGSYTSEGSSNRGRRSGVGAGLAVGDGLRHEQGVPTLAEFLSNSFGQAQARQSPHHPSPYLFSNPNFSPLAAPLARDRRRSDGEEDMRGRADVSLSEIMNHLLGIVSDPISPNRRGANGTGGLANDPYFQMLQGRGGLGAIFGGGTGQVGDYVTSQEAFDSIVTQLAQAAGPSASRPPPASKAIIDDLPIIPIDSYLLTTMETKECTVCLSSFELEELCKRLPCTHLFHSGCINTWLEANGSCPVCRYSLVAKKSEPVGEASGSRGREGESRVESS